MKTLVMGAKQLGTHLRKTQLVEDSEMVSAESVRATLEQTERFSVAKPVDPYVAEVIDGFATEEVVEFFPVEGDLVYYVDQHRDWTKGNVGKGG